MYNPRIINTVAMQTHTTYSAIMTNAW